MKGIESLVRRLVARHQTSDPFFICKALGISVLYADLPKVTNGVFYRLGTSRVVLIRQELSPHEARVACAHELGHALLHRDLNYQFMAQNTRLVTGRYEREADYFCVCLLMGDRANELDGGTTVEQLAGITGIPRPLVDLWNSLRENNSQ